MYLLGRSYCFHHPFPVKNMGFTLKEKKEEQKTEGQEGGGSSSLGGGRGKGRDPENQSLRSPHRGAWPAQWTLGSRGLRDGDREGLTRRAQLMRSSSLATTYSPRLLGSAAGLGTTALAWDTAGWVLDTDTWHGEASARQAPPLPPPAAQAWGRTCLIAVPLGPCPLKDLVSSTGKWVWLTHCQEAPGLDMHSQQPGCAAGGWAGL